MKRVYIDWGVISNLKKPEFAEVREFLLSRKGDLFFVYSPAHFEDAMRSKGDDRLAQDILTLESLVDNHLIAYNKKTVQPFLATPTEYYRDNKDCNLSVIPDITEMLPTISQDIPVVGGPLKSFLDIPFPFPDAARSNELVSMILPDLPTSPTLSDVIHSATLYMNKMLNDKEFYKSYRTAVRASGFKVDSNAGNWEANEVVPNITARIKSFGIDKSFEDFVMMGFGDKKNVDDFKFFMAAYSLLDMIGYKSDKLPKSSNAMNSVNTDAQHAYYAAFCDYFITQDTHLTSKALALYEGFGISTKILTPQNAIKVLDKGRDDDLVLFLQEQLIEENIERCEERSIVYKFTKRYLGIFTHCVRYDEDDTLVLEFKLAFDNYSYFIFYDEAAIMVDAVADYLGRPSKEDYEKARKRIVAGDTGASINWQGNGILLTLCADPERHRPELFITINTVQEQSSICKMQNGGTEGVM